MSNESVAIMPRPCGPDRRLLARNSVPVTSGGRPDCRHPRTAKYKGYHFDIGGHRFFSKSKEVEEFWSEISPTTC
jgi:hypothetical protein